MTVLTHRSIRGMIQLSGIQCNSYVPTPTDGWFRQISSQWPGQAISLKVSKILHVERSLYQDVLVFESETYGNALVLYGGGDGGVVREVLKHGTVEEVVPCDIDEVRMSRLFPTISL